MKNTLKNAMGFIALTLVLSFVAHVLSHAQKANFSGTWTMNEQKSKLPEGGNGGGGRMGGGTFTVTQDANTLTQTRTGQDGTARVSKYNLDGKESINETRGGQSKSTAKWSPDGKKLIITSKSNYNGNERTSTQTWSLIDSKTLSIVRESQSGRGNSTMVYDKK